MGSVRNMTIILDDQRSDVFTFGGGGGAWSVKQADQWFNGTTQSLDSAVGATSSSELGTVQLKFEGTSVALFGTTPPSSSSQVMAVSIDASAPSNTSYSDPNPQTYRQWYQSPNLSDGQHTLELTNIAGTALDFAVVTVGKNFPLKGQTVIVDNDDPAISYSTKKGKWRRNQSSFNSGPNPDGFGYGNTTHDTTYVASSFSYKFSAVSIAVYGVRSWGQIGALTIDFSIDGDILTKHFPVTADTPQFKNETGQQQNFLFHSFDFLSAGAHTLTANVTECVNQTFSFDYITYSPNFESFAKMPDVGVASADDDGSSGSSSGAGQARKSSSKAPIIGGVVAAIVLLGVIVGLAVFLRRRRRRNGGGSGFMGRSESKTKYSPLEAVPFEARPPPQVTVSSTPLAHERTPSQTPFTDLSTTAALSAPAPTPGSANTSHSTNLGPMAQMQNASAIQYGLPFPHAQHGHNRSTSEADPPNQPSTAGATAPDTSTDGETRDGEPSPPSYDEVTGGKAPTHVTYVIQR